MVVVRWSFVGVWGGGLLEVNRENQLEAVADVEACLARATTSALGDLAFRIVLPWRAHMAVVVVVLVVVVVVVVGLSGSPLTHSLA